MSVTYRAMVVVGVRVMVQDILAGKNRRACGCKVEGTPNYCPNCGNPFHVKVDITEIEAELSDVSTLEIHGRTHISECDDVIIGDVICDSYEDSPSKIVTPYSEADMKVLFQELQKHGFASDITQIKTYSFLYTG